MTFPLVNDALKRKRLVYTAYMAPLLLIATSVPPVLILLAVFHKVTIFAALIATELAIAAAIGWALAMTGNLANWRDLLGYKNFAWKKMLFGLGWALLVLGCLALTSSLFSALGLKVHDSNTSDEFANLHGATRYIVLLAGASFIVPFLEESFFRGYVLMFLVRGWSLEDKPLTSKLSVIALLTSAFYFALAHFQGASSLTDAMVLVWTFVFAMGNAVLRRRTHSLYPCILAHATYNFISVLALLSTH